MISARPWTKTQERQLRQAWEKGHKISYIAEEMGRSESSIKNKVRVLELKVRQKRKVSSFRGVNYKKVIPEQEWPYMCHFLSTFKKLSEIAKCRNREINIGVFLNEYRSIYGSRLKEVQNASREKPCKR